jgi:site-specific DNA-methyltransferase (cytosine-N4-specific)
MDGTLVANPSALHMLTGDWDFATARTDILGGIHPYPAKFIPEIPRRLIEAFRPADGLALLDPFCGSGTALTEAQAAGLPSLGVDLNPIAVLMSRVKTSPVPRGASHMLSEVIELARSDLAPALPEIPRLNHWFEPAVQNALASLAAAIASHGGAATDLLRLALSSIIVRVSNQESDTRYAAVFKAVGRDEVFRQFVRAAQKTIDVLEGRDIRRVTATVIESDVLALDRSAITRPIGLVITSPPYPNAYEYWLYHKYRMWWLGFDPLAVKAREIGARAHFFKGKNSHTVAHFSHQMANVMRMLKEVMVPGGHACFVVGRSRIHGEMVDNAAAIALAGSACGFEESARVERVIAPTRKSFNLSHANIKTETILVLRKRA